MSDDNRIKALEEKLQNMQMELIGIKALLNNQANILKYVVTPLIIVIGALSGINLMG